MKTLKNLNEKHPKIMRPVYITASLLCVLGLWQIFAATVFSKSGIVPPPLSVFKEFFKNFAQANFWKAVFFTVSKSLVSFLLSFVLGFFLSVLARLSFTVRHFLEPLVSLLRSVPTLGITLIMFIFYSGTTAAVIVGMLVTMPMTYENMYAALSNVDRKLIEMAKLYKIKSARQFTSIYFPAVLPYLFSSALAALGLNLKVIIAAEIIGIPKSSVGSFLKSAYSWGDYSALFMWLLTAVLIAFLFEAVIKLFAKLSMPWNAKGKEAG